MYLKNVQPSQELTKLTGIWRGVHIIFMKLEAFLWSDF